MKNIKVVVFLFIIAILVFVVKAEELISNETSNTTSEMPPLEVLPVEDTPLVGEIPVTIQPIEETIPDELTGGLVVEPSILTTVMELRHYLENQR